MYILNIRYLTSNTRQNWGIFGLNGRWISLGQAAPLRSDTPWKPAAMIEERCSCAWADFWRQKHAMQHMKDLCTTSGYERYIGWVCLTTTKIVSKLKLGIKGKLLDLEIAYFQTNPQACSDVCWFLSANCRCIHLHPQSLVRVCQSSECSRCEYIHHKQSINP